MRKGILQCDGASRGNPGPAAVGFTLKVDSGDYYRGGSYIGETTNNVAEYTALVWGLENARGAGVNELEILADSELMVNQLTGVYRVKNEGLKPLYAQAKILIGTFDKATINHVYRSDNSEADALANEALDIRGTVGEFLRKPTVKQSLFDLASAPAVTNPEPILVAETPASITTRQTEETTMQTSLEPSAGGMYELTVKDHFDAAHALIGYPGQCKNLHGHTWEVEVSVEGTMLDSVGILYDFKTLKDDLAHILAIFDHAYLNDLDMFKDMNSTAENMARLVYDELSGKLPENVKLTEVCIWESPIARLRYRR